MEPLFTNTYKMTEEIYSNSNKKIIKDRKSNRISNIVLNITYILIAALLILSIIVSLLSDNVIKGITTVAPPLVIVVAFFFFTKILKNLVIKSAYRASVSLYGLNYEVTGNFYDDYFEENTAKSCLKYSYDDITAIYFSDNLLIFKIGRSGAIISGFIVDMNGFGDSDRQAFTDFITSRTGLEVKI